MSAQPVLIDGKLIASSGTETFQVVNPNTKETLPEVFPLSPWTEIERCLSNAAVAFDAMRSLSREQIGQFLEGYASAVENHAEDLVATAHAESGLPVSPRLKDVELPRTTSQLRQAAMAARSASWTNPIIDSKANIRSCLEPLGPIAVFGPNNFPFAFNSIAGGDFAAAIAAGNPVIAKANTSHPHTSLKFAKLVAQVIEQQKLPANMVQMIYRTSHQDGEKFVADSRLAASGYTGSRHAGLKLKAAADAAGKPFYAELSSINPVVILAGCLAEKGEAMVADFVTSGLMGAGQFCTNPGLLLIPKSDAGDQFVAGVIAKYKDAKPGTLLTPSVCRSLRQGVDVVKTAGAKLSIGGNEVQDSRVAFENTVLEVDAALFLKSPEKFQTEMFGNAVLIVRCESSDETVAVIKSLEGNLTGCIYSATDGSDDAAYHKIAPELARKVGRLLNDKMPTGVAVSPAMNHGGPFPATAHPNFTAVGLPSSIGRFAKLTCYDAVRENRLPDILRNQNPIPNLFRSIDGQFTTASL